MAKKLSFSIAVNLLTENFKKGTNAVKAGFRSMQMQVLTFAAALGAGGLGLAGLLSRFKDVARETSRVHTALKNVSEGTKGFADNLRFVNDLAEKYGLQVNALTGNFAKFTASATQANMNMDQQQKVFESLSRASTAFGLSAEDTNGVFLALSQMMGKGKISSEELRKQMGERIPIAMQAMAKAAGVSMAGLEKLLQQGKLMSSEIIPKFADALNEMIPNVDTDSLESSLNKLSNTFTNMVNSSGFQEKYKALIDGLTSMIQSASKNIQTIIVGVVAAIGFVITNGLTKIYRGYAETGKKIINTATTTHNKLRATIASRVEAEKRLEELKLQHAQASGRQQVALAKQIEKQKQLLSARTAQVNIAHENAKAAAANAAAIKSRGAWATAFAAIVGSAKRMIVALKSMWNTFAPAIIISAIIALVGYLKNMYTEAKRVKNIFSEYKKEAEQSGNTQEVKMLQTQLAIMNDKTKSQKQINEAQSKLLGMLGSEKLNQKEINEAVKERIKLLKAAAQADYYAQKAVATEDAIKSRASKLGWSEQQLIDLANKKDSISKKELQYKIGETHNENGVKGRYSAGDALKAIDETYQDLLVLNDANEKLKNAVVASNQKSTTITTTEPDKAAIKLAEKRLEALRKLDDADRKRQIDKLKFDLEMQQRAIDLLDDGFEKRTRQTLLNLQKEHLEIAEKESDFLKQQQDYLKTKYVSVQGTDKGFESHYTNLKKNNFKDDKGIDVLPEGLRPEDIASQVGELTKAAKAAQQKGLNDINKDLSAMLSEQRLMFASNLDRTLSDLDDYYNERLKKAGKNAELIDQIEANRGRAKKEAYAGDRINQLNFEEQLKQEQLAGMESIGMTELVERKKNDLTKKYIQLRIDALKDLVDAGDEDAAKQIQLYQESIKQMDMVKPAKGLKELADQAIFNAIKNGFKKIGDSVDEAEAKTIKLLSSIRGFAGEVSKITSMMQSMFGGLDEGLDQAMSAVNNIASGFANGIESGIAAVVSEGMKLFINSKKVNEEHREAIRLLKLQAAEQKHMYELEQRRAELADKGSSVYGSDKWKQASNATKIYNDQVKKLDQSIKALKDVDVVTGSRKSGWGFWKKRKDVWSDLLATYPQLIKANGEFDATLAETILSTQKLSESGKQAIQQAIDNAKLLEDAFAELKGYLSDVFSDLGNNMMNAFVEAFKGTKNAISDFVNDASGLLGKMVQDFIYSMRLAPIIEKASKEAENMMLDNKLTEDQKNQEMINITGQLIDDLLKQQGYIFADLERWGDLIKKETGNNPFSADSKSQDSTKGYSVSMDQDTGGAILGRITGIHESILEIKSMIGGITLDTSKYLSQFITIGDELKKHTGMIYEMQQMQVKSYRLTEKVNDSLSVLTEMKDDLNSISKNTKYLAPK